MSTSTEPTWHTSQSLLFSSNPNLSSPWRNRPFFLFLYISLSSLTITHQCLLTKSLISFFLLSSVAKGGDHVLRPTIADWRVLFVDPTCVLVFRCPKPVVFSRYTSGSGLGVSYRFLWLRFLLIDQTNSIVSITCHSDTVRRFDGLTTLFC